MFNILASIYTNAAARNPGPVLIAFLVFAVPLFVFLISTPDRYAYFKTPEYKAKFEAWVKRDMEAYRRAIEYCEKNKLPPMSIVFATVDGERFTKTCGSLPPPR